MTSTSIRVAVVGINYAPEPVGIAPYTTDFCEEMAGQGHDVYVLAGLPSYPSWRIHDDYRGRRAVDERINGVRVRRLWHYVPAHQSGLRRAMYEATFGAHVARQELPWSPDVVVSVVPSLLGAAAGAGLAKRYDAPHAIWVQDLMGAAAAQSGISGGGKFARWASRSERKLLRSADHVFVINESFAEHVEDLGVDRGKVTVVRNWSRIGAPRMPRAAVRRKMGWSADETIVLHSGNMGYKQALENVVGAAIVAEQRGSRARFVLMGDGNQRDLIELLGRDVSRLDIIDPVDDAEYPDTLAAADVLLVNERPTVAGMSLPSKLTSYFRAGRPVVAAVSDQSATAAEIKASGAALLVEPDAPDGLLTAVETLTRDRLCAERLTEAAARYADDVLDPSRALQKLTGRVVRLANPPLTLPSAVRVHDAWDVSAAPADAVRS